MHDVGISSWKNRCLYKGANPSAIPTLLDSKESGGGRYSAGRTEAEETDEAENSGTLKYIYPRMVCHEA